MPRTTLNHVSIHAHDLDVSAAFYEDLFGMASLPTPVFRFPVRWLRLGDQQLHLLVRETPTPLYHHFGLDVEDFDAVYRRALELDALDRESFYSHIYELPGGAVQMYLRDPAGNIVEVDWPDVTTLDRELIGEIPRLADTVTQDEAALRSSLHLRSGG